MPKIGVSSNPPSPPSGGTGLSRFLPKIFTPRPAPLASSDGEAGGGGREVVYVESVDVELDELDSPPGAHVRPERREIPAASTIAQDTSRCGRQQHALVRALESVPMQAAILLLIAFDLTLTIYQIAEDVSHPSAAESTWVLACTITIVSLLLLEVSLRVIGLGPRVFFASWVNRLDLAVSALSLALELIVVATFAAATSSTDPYAVANVSNPSNVGGDAAAASNFAALRVLRPLARIMRVSRVVTRVLRQQGHLQTAARHVVGGNKRRFHGGGFDLDLVYVTDSLIGMSVPAVGGMSLYRNPIDEVARFFKTYHPDNFMLYNCTSECTYPAGPFDGNVRRYAIDDHNVPLLETIVCFCRELEELAITRPGIVFAIHCRGGKGRTGTMVCAWLLWTRHCASAEEALELFQRRRTDERIKGKWQGVETASQKRYVRYVEQYLSSPTTVSLAPWRPLRRVTIRNLFPDRGGAPETLLPWIVISHFGPLGRISLDTKLTLGAGQAKCVTQSGHDLIFDLRGLQLRGDVKLELFAEKSAGVAYLDMEPRSERQLTIESASSRSVWRDPSTACASGKQASSKAPEQLPSASAPRTPSAKRGRGSVVSSVLDAVPLSIYPNWESGPPASGADRQLIMFTWLHLAFETGCDGCIELSATELDSGNGMKPLFKKLKQRAVSIEIQFEESDDAPDVAPAASSTTSSAALDRARSANALAARGLGVARAASPPVTDDPIDEPREV